jgi:hypothetical protein
MPTAMLYNCKTLFQQALDPSFPGYTRRLQSLPPLFPRLYSCAEQWRGRGSEVHLIQLNESGAS